MLRFIVCGIVFIIFFHEQEINAGKKYNYNTYIYRQVSDIAVD